MKSILMVAALALMPLAAHAEIEKTATLDCKTNSVCFHWRPKVAVPDGWRQEAETSAEENINFLVPKTAVDARLFIYANAIDTKNQAATLPGFIDDDIQSFHRAAPDITVTELPPLTTADGQSLRTFRFDPKTKGRWEITAYGEESDKDGNHYYVVFVLSAVSRALRDENLGAYTAMIKAYRK